MTNLFKVKLTKTSEDFEKLFQLAFQDIYDLTEKICNSQSKTIKGFRHFMDEPWVILNGDSIAIIAECYYVVIGKQDAYENTSLEYDFGKRSPANDAFLFAIMSIFYHYIPETEFYNEVAPYEDHFDDGVILARLVNDKIKNPFMDKLIPLEQLIVSKHIKKVYLALTDKSSNKIVRFYY